MTVPALSLPALSLRGISRSFGGVAAATEVSFDVAAGQICALVGPNGAGKTTLFNLITGILPPSAGSVLLFGTRHAGASAGKIARLGLIRTFQSARVFPGLTVLENALVGRHRLLRQTVLSSMLGLPGTRREERDAAARAEGLLNLVGLLPYRDSHAADLPMGAQKLLEIVRALLAQPRVLLLDEPAAGLNDTETEELAALLRAIRAAGITVLLVEHNMPLVMGVADCVVVLEAGRLIAAGLPGEVRVDPRVVAAYLGAEAA